MPADKTECVLLKYGWLAARSRFTHAMCGLPRVVLITESLGKRLDHFRFKTDQTYWGSKQPRDYCTSSYVRQNFSGAPIWIAVHPSVRSSVCAHVTACDTWTYVHSIWQKKNFTKRCFAISIFTFTAQLQQLLYINISHVQCYEIPGNPSTAEKGTQQVAVPFV